MVTIDDLRALEEKILEERRAVETSVKIKSGEKIIEIPVAIIIRPKAKIKQLQKGFLPITVDEIRREIKDCETFEQQQDKILKFVLQAYKFYKTAEETRNLFKGKYIDFN